MRRFMIRNGDPTTTGGRVLAFASTMFDDGNRVALHSQAYVFPRWHRQFDQGFNKNQR